MKRPAFQFYPADWRKDTELQGCSIGARGLWHELLCVMHECEPYGHLTLNGEAIPEPKAARLVGVEVKEYRRLMLELDVAGVPSRTAKGVIYSRRMVRDEALRNKRAVGGGAGAEHGAKGGSYGPLGGRPKAPKGGYQPPLNGAKGGIEPPLNPPPSSSSSSSNNGVQTPGIDARTTAETSKPGGDRSPGKAKPAKGWHQSEEGTKAMGEWLGLPPRRGEIGAEYRARLFDALAESERAA